VAATQVPGVPIAPYGVPYGVPPYVYGGYPPYQTSLAKVVSAAARIAALTARAVPSPP
jgi:energy-converting hydrogenase Eha subunit F